MSLLGAAGSAAGQRTRSGVLAILGGLWCGAVAVLILLSFAFTLNLAFEKHATVWLYRVFAESGMRDADAYVVRNSLESASQILIRVPVTAVLLSAGAGFLNSWITEWQRPVTTIAASFTPLVFLVGVASLWCADSLARAARPPLIMGGLIMTGIALCAAHPLWSSVHGGRRSQQRKLK